MLRRLLPLLHAAIRPAQLWPLLVVAAACVPVAGALSTSRIFHVRDLGLFFWPRHLWIRESLLDGQFPLWDPYAAAGQSAAADALNHLFFPFAIVLRFLPAVVGFNLWVALPFPLAAAGMYVLLRDRVSRSAAALGAVVFVASGPVVSTGNFPNFSWAMAAMPWVLWSASRLAVSQSRGWFAATAMLLALQALAGEPVTLFATGTMAAAWVWFGDSPRPLAARVRSLAWFGGACIVAVLLAAVQLVPLAAAAAGSTRVDLQDPGMWSLHPLALLEVVAPHLFGDTYEASYDRLQWVQPLNSDREPLLFSIYVGIGALVLAAHGLSTRRDERRRLVRFWASVTLAAAVLALGTYTPVYGIVLGLIPPLQGLRFPVKHLIVAMLGMAVLAAVGWERLRSGSPGVAAAPGHVPVATLAAFAVAAVGATAAIAPVVAPAAVGHAAAVVGATVGVDDAAAAGIHMVDVLPAMGGRLLLLAAIAGGLLWVITARRPEARFAAVALFALLVFDPLSVNARMHPTLPAELMGPPSWTNALPTGEPRIYIGGKTNVPGTMRRIDAIERSAVDVDATEAMIGAQTLAFTQYAMAPAAWGLREIVSYDLPQLWPREYHRMLRHFAGADRDARLRFLSRVGVGFCLLPEPPAPGVRSLAEAAWLPTMALYECGPTSSRARVVSKALVEPDLERHFALLLDQAFDARDIVILHSEPADGIPSTHGAAPADGHVQIAADESRRVVVRAAAGPEGGYLVLLDTYDPDWTVRVDGQPTPMLRANGIFRAVPLEPGAHLVEFSHRPRAVYAGSALSFLVVACLVLTPCWRWVSPSRFAGCRPRTLRASLQPHLGGEA